MENAPSPPIKKSELIFLVLLVNVLVKIGDVVNAGETIIILDAMKMENILKSDYKAKVLEIFIEKGQAVSADQNLIKIQQLN